MKQLHRIIVGLFLVMVSFIVTNAQGQGVTVQGKITDPDNKPIHGVTVAEVDAEGRTIKATRTDIDGNFSLKIANTNHKLSVSHISFKSVDLTINNRTVFNQVFQSSSRDLGEVVIVSQRKADNGMVPIAERNLTT